MSKTEKIMRYFLKGYLTFEELVEDLREVSLQED